MITKSEAFTYSNDHLLKASSIISTEFWAVHAKLNSDFESRTEQLQCIKELTDLGNALVKINEARSALF